MMRRIVLLLMMGLMCVSIVSYAQEGCDINLEDTVLRLMQAQRAADTGDTLTATSILSAVQSDIDAIQTGCEQIRFTEKYVTPDEQLAFFHPNGWRVQNLDRDVYIVASSTAIVSELENDLPEELEPGEAAIAIQIQALGDQDFEDSLEDLMDDVRGDMQVISRIEDVEIGGRRHVAMSVEVSPTVRGRIGIIDYSEAEVPATVLVFGLADQGSLPIIEVYTDTLRESVQYPPTELLRTTGISMESVTYTDPIDLRTSDMFDTGPQPMLSPDGNMLAWEAGDELCIHEIPTETERCTAIPDRFSGRIPLLLWSPDGRYLALHQDFVRTFIEPDVWLFDVVDSTFVNITDDGDTQFRMGSDFVVVTWLDTTVTWGPDNQLYIMRTTMNQGASSLYDGTNELIKVDPDSGETTVVQDLTGILEPFAVVYAPGYSLDGVMSVSPDATQLVIAVREPDAESRNNGVWLIDLRGANEPQMIATIEEFRLGYHPNIYANDDSHGIESLAWDADGRGIYVYLVNNTFATPTAMVSHMDLDSGDIVPLIDLTEFNTREPLLTEDGGEEVVLDHLMPRSPVLTPDYAGIVYATLAVETSGLSMVQFAGEPSEPTVIYETDRISYAGNTTYMASNGTLLMNANLFLPE